MMGTLQLAAIPAFGIIGPRQGMMRTAHVAPGWADFSFRDRHGPPLLSSVTVTGLLAGRLKPPKQT